MCLSIRKWKTDWAAEMIFSTVCVFFHHLASAAAVLESLAAQRVAVVRLVPESWMVKKQDKEASLTL